MPLCSTLRALLRLLILGLCCPFVHAAPAAEFHVAPGGSDAHPGTKAKPFATLEAARNAIRAVKSQTGLPAGGITVWLHGGAYSLKNSFVLESQDSGSPAAPITYAAAPGERASLLGGVRLDPAWFSPVTDQDPAWARLDPAARGHLLQADLKAHGLADYGKLAPRGFSNREQTSALELFLDGAPLTLARWPNEGFERVAATPAGKDGRVFTYSGDRPARWNKAADPWVFGYFVEKWADSYCPIARIDAKQKSIRLGSNPSYGILPKAEWFALNLLEEIDRPGEWYLDRARGVLYLWPPAPLDGRRLYASQLETPLVHAAGASFVTFRGLTFEVCRASAVAAEECDQFRLEQCQVRNTGGCAVRISGGRSSGLDRCEITGAGAGGVSLFGGDRAALVSCDHFVTNSHIHAYNRWNRTYTPAVLMKGVGCRAAHNLLHDAPHFALSYDGNEHLVEYNDIHDVCQVTDDAGAIYTGRDWGERGNVVRYNYIHDIGSSLDTDHGVHGVYLDDCASGNAIFGNIFYRISFCGAFVGGGHDNVVENNIFVECGRAAYHVDYRGQRITETPGDTWNLRERIQRVNYDRPPWSTKYPSLAAIFKNGYEAAKWPSGNRLVRNIGFKNKAWIHRYPKGVEERVEQRDNIIDADPLFVDASARDLRLRPESPALKITGFKPIPFEKIGIER